MLRAISPLLHSCTSCGASCRGTIAHLVSPQEVERARAQAVELGIVDAVQGQRLRHQDGACVFLEEGGLCAVHRRFGASEKPLICQQYPVVLVRCADGERVGVDPGCMSASVNWQGAPKLQLGTLVANRSELSPQELAHEATILGWCEQDGISVGGLLRSLSAGRLERGPELPRDFAGAWVGRMQGAPLDTLLSAPETGQVLSAPLAALLSARPHWRASRPPSWPVLSAQDDAWAVETLRRVLFLRLVSSSPSVLATAVLVLGGAVACGWAAGGGPGFGPALSAWTRAIRAPRFGAALLPNPGALVSLFGA